jgi:hypothetical protein
MPEFSNEDAVLLALWRLGGERDQIHLEDVAIEADQIAQGRFRWRKYKEHINIQTVGKALRDAKKHETARGTSARGWMLTDAGVSLVRELETRERPAVRRALSAQEKAWLAKERIRLTTEPAYLGFRTSGLLGVAPRDALRFFRIDEYVTGELRQARVDRLVRMFEDDADLGPVARALSALVGAK